MRVLDRAVWAPRAALHFERVVDILAPFAGGVDAAAASSYDRSHPILNFLFDYYHFDRRALLRWTPGAGITLDGVSKLRDQKMLWLGNGCAFSRDGHAVYDAAHASASVRRNLAGSAEILRNTALRPPRLNCFGLHEWAMLYQPAPAAAPPSTAFQRLPLRLPQTELNAVVEAQPLACTHWDAVRFFTPEAAPLNEIKPAPARAAQRELEQPGCVHANMDLFRWCCKLFPFGSSELLADTLELALEARVLDMRASPYDLAAYAGDGGGFDATPVAIEHESGREEYRRIQASIAHRAVPLRARLIEEIDGCLESWRESENGAN